jgi:hypothetical protein
MYYRLRAAKALTLSPQYRGDHDFEVRKAWSTKGNVKRSYRQHPEKKIPQQNPAIETA